VLFNWVGRGWLWVSMFDVFWVLFWVVVLSGVFWPQVSIVCACARGLAHLVYLFTSPLDFK